MRVAYFPNQCAQNSAPVMQAMLSGLRKHGHQPCENTWDADATIIWSVLWWGRMAENHAVWQHYREHDRPVIIVDVGALYRGETWKIALNSVTADGYYGHQEDLDWDRPRKLCISQAMNLSRNPRIVVAAQHARSLQVAELDSVESWIIDQVTALREHTDRPITVRPHPRSRLHADKLRKVSNQIVLERPQRLSNSHDSYNLAFDCHAMINHNSGPGIQAALAGTRPLVHQSSLAYPVSIQLQQLEEPYRVDRDQWLVEICHTEYTLAEIEKGTWITRLKL
jgi:hypothetical protein